MTIWQIIIVVCLYLIIGGIIAAITDIDDVDYSYLCIAFWPVIAISIVIICVPELFGNIGKFIVNSVTNVITAFKRVFGKKEGK